MFFAIVVIALKLTHKHTNVLVLPNFPNCIGKFSLRKVRIKKYLQYPSFRILHFLNLSNYLRCKWAILLEGYSVFYISMKRGQKC